MVVLIQLKLLLLATKKTFFRWVEYSFPFQEFFEHVLLLN